MLRESRRTQNFESRDGKVRRIVRELGDVCPELTIVDVRGEYTKPMWARIHRRSRSAQITRVTLTDGHYTGNPDPFRFPL